MEYGRHPRAGPTLFKEPQSVELNDIMKSRIEAQEQAKAALVLAAEQIKWYYDKGVQLIPFQVGDSVLLKLSDYQQSAWGLCSRFDGPFKILKKVSEVDFLLDLPSCYRGYHPVFHASKLITYTEPTIPRQKVKPPPPAIVDNEEEWEVEKILQHRRKGNKTEYLVWWKGFGQADDTWESENNLKHAKSKLRDYKKLGYAAVKSIEYDTIDLEIEALQNETNAETT